MNKKITAKKNSKFGGFVRKATTMASSAFAMAMMSAVPASANAIGGENVIITADGETNAGNLMGQIIGILLTITRFVGVALVIYGVYEIVMSFMQNQPEAKTKGIIMALAGVVMIALKSVLVGMGIVA